MYHNSKINDLHSRLSSKEMLQNLLYLKKTYVYFLFFISGNFNFFTNMNGSTENYQFRKIPKRTKKENSQAAKKKIKIIRENSQVKKENSQALNNKHMITSFSLELYINLTLLYEV